MQHDRYMMANTTCYRGVIGIVVTGVVAIGLYTAATGQMSPVTAQTPATGGAQTDAAAANMAAAKIVGPGPGEATCAKCHAPEYEAWQTTHHFTSFTQRHRSKEARAILHNLGERSMKRSDYCRQCHYTSILTDDKLRPKWGVSCESCHGPAHDWVNIHQKRGGDPKADNLKWGTSKDESKAARDARLQAAQKQGMVTSDMIDAIATNCYSCHTVPNETLVNKGKHKAGSDFDLVAWSQGEVRHNFSSSPGAPDQPTNSVATPERLRRLYVVGAMVDLAVSLRNLGNAKQPNGEFHQAMAARVKKARAKIAAILKAVDIPELRSAMAASEDVPAALRAASKTLAQTYDGTTLAALDPLIPQQYKGDPYTK